MDGPDALEALRSLIAEEVARWSLDHRRGLHPYDLAEPDIVIERAFRNLAGYGPLGPLLDDDHVWEIMINAPAQIFPKRHSGTSSYHDKVVHDDHPVPPPPPHILHQASTSPRNPHPPESPHEPQPPH